MRTGFLAVYRVGDVEIDLGARQIRRGGETVHLRQQTFQLLCHLLTNRDRVVPKEELLEVVWGPVAVSDDALTQCVKELRKALDDDAREPRFIRTVPRVGYHFVGVDGSHARPRRAIGRWMAAAAVVVLAASGTWLAVARATRPSASRGGAPRTMPVLVMFLDNTSERRDLDWLREGLADMLITDLARSPALSVVGSRQVVSLMERRRLKRSDRVPLDVALDLARASHADTLVMGTFAATGDKLRVDLQTYDVASARVVGGERINVDGPDQILTEIDTLASRVATSLGRSTGPARGEARGEAATGSLEAYRYYSLGVEKADAFQDRQAVDLLERAIAIDPDFAMAQARIGYIYAMTLPFASKAKPYLERAFRLSDRLNDHDRLSIRAWYAVANGEFLEAIDCYRQLIARDPGDVEAYWWLGHLLLGEERFDESIAVLERGLRIDPESARIMNELGSVYQDSARYDDAIAMRARYALQAPGEPNAYDSLGLAYQAAGRFDEAQQAYDRAIAVDPTFALASLHRGNLHVRRVQYRQALQQFQRFVDLGGRDFDRARGLLSIAIVHLKKRDQPTAWRYSRMAHVTWPESDKFWLTYAVERTRPDSRVRLANFTAHDSLGRGSKGNLRQHSYLLGMIAMDQGRVDEALQCFQELWRHRPTEFDIESFDDVLANTYLALGRTEDAAREYRRLIDTNPRHALAHYGLARTYEANGRAPAARAEYRRFLALWRDADPDVPEIVDARSKLRR